MKTILVTDSSSDKQLWRAFRELGGYSRAEYDAAFERRDGVPPACDEVILLGAQVQRALGVVAPPLDKVHWGGATFRCLPTLDDEWHRLAAGLLLEEMVR